MRVILPILFVLSGCGHDAPPVHRDVPQLSCRDPQLPPGPRAFDALVAFAQDEHDALVDCKAKLAKALSDLQAP